MHLHDRLNAILTWPGKDLTSNEAADLLGLNRSTIARSLRFGHMEGSVVRGRGRMRKLHYRICKAALVKWMWDSTTGDKAMMRAELTKNAPQLLAVLDAGDAAKAAEVVKARKRPKAAVSNDNQLDLFFNPNPKPNDEHDPNH